MYYLLYDIDYELPSKVAFDPDEPSLGRMRVDSVSPPHSLTFIKRCLLRVEEKPAFAWQSHTVFFANTSSDTPLKEGDISILCTDGPGLSPYEPMAILLRLSFQDGRYFIKNRAKNIFWEAYNPIVTVYFNVSKMDEVKKRESSDLQVNNHSPIIQVFRG